MAFHLTFVGGLYSKNYNRRRSARARKSFLESLESRHLLAVASPPTQPLTVTSQPVALESGLIDHDSAMDLVALSRSGTFSVALNGNNDTWRPVSNLNLGLGPTVGMAGGLINGDAALDLVVLGDSTADVVLADGQGGFRRATSLNVPMGSHLQPSEGEVATALIGFLDADHRADIVLLDTLNSQLLIYYGQGSERFSDPVILATGATDPTSIALGDVVGDGRADMVVGHRDGSLTFLSLVSGVVSGLSWSIDLSATLRSTQSIRSLAIADLDQDGDNDIAVSADANAYVLLRDASTLTTSPIENGDFALGLTGWTTSVQGQADGGLAGTVQALSGRATFVENESHLTSLSQSFVVPPNPRSLTINISQLRLESPSGGIPDAFELSLLAEDQNSLVPTHRPSATSFFNASAAASGALQISMASGVRFDGSLVTLDISRLAPGTTASFIIDLVGNPSGVNSTAIVEDVSIDPASSFSHSFQNRQLPGSFGQPRTVRTGDVDGDNRSDIVLLDRGSSRLAVFHPTEQAGTFTRSDVNLSGMGAPPSALTLGAFDRQPAIDVAVALRNADRVLSPLRSSDSSGGRWLPDIDFERNAVGDLLHEGVPISEQFISWGVSIRGEGGSPTVLNWSRSVDPNSSTAGSQANVLALARLVEDHDDDDHHHGDDDDDDETKSRHSFEYDHHGDDDDRWVIQPGTIRFDFASSVMLDEVRLLGIKPGSYAWVRVFDASGAIVHSIRVDGIASGDLQSARLDARDVTRMTVEFFGVGSIAQVIFCRDIAAGSRIALGGGSQVEEGSFLQLQLESPLVAASSWLINWGDGHIDNLVGDPTQAMHRYADGTSRKTIYATARDGLGNVYLANLWQLNVLNVPPTLAIDGPTSVEAGMIYTLNLSSTDPGIDTLKRWIIDWGDGSQSSLAGSGTLARHTYKNALATPLERVIRAMARDEDNPGGQAYQSNAIRLQVLPDSSRKLPTIDFDRAADGSVIRSPQRAGNQFAELGLTISSPSGGSRGPVIIDSSKPSWASRDVATPNSSYGGPGSGRGGAHGQTGANSTAQRNVLILATDVNSTTPEDHENGGTLVFEFAMPTAIEELHLLDIDKSGSSIKLFNADGISLGSYAVPNRGTNSFQVVRLSASHVSRMEVILQGGGAIAAIVSQRDATTIARPDSRFFVVDTNDQIFRYSATGKDIGEFPSRRSAQPRGIAADADANPLWIISEGGAKDEVLVYDSSNEKLLGEWTPTGVDRPQGIATDGNDIWIVDSAKLKVWRYAGAASRRSGIASPTASFPLATGNSQPTDLVTDGSTLWVVDAGSDRVYQYSLTGHLTGSWSLDPANADASGVAIQPNQPDGLYVLDANDRRVYSYANRRWDNALPQLATSSFALAPGNALPVGLADPGGQLALGAIVNETLSANATAEWTFDGTVNQSIYINFQSLTEPLSWELFSPTGQLLSSRSSFRASGLDSGTLLLNATGIFRLALAAGTTASSYQFQIFDVPSPDVQTVSFGQINVGALNSPGRLDHWTFNGTTGARYFLNFLTLDTVVGGDLVVEVRSPSGQVVSTRTATRESSLDQIFTLTETGEWTIVMRAAFDGSQLPAYSFQLTEVPADNFRDLSFRQTALGALASPGARDVWRFQATGNQSIFFDMQSLAGGDIRVQILSPDTTTLSDRTFSLASGLDVQLTLPANGLYTVIIDGAGSANLNSYQFVIWDVPPDILQAASINSTISGNTVPGQVVRYEFDGQAGLPVLLDIIDSSNLALGVTIAAPDGQLLVDRETRDRLLTLPATGRYLATVSRSSPFFLDGFGSYAFRIQDRTAPVIGRPDSLGTQFSVAFPMNLRQPFGANNPAFSLSITSSVDTSGTVQIPGLNFSTSYQVVAGVATRVDLPSEVEIMDSDVIVNKAVLVTALDEVAVYGLNQMAESTDGFTALPTDVLGTDYFVLGYANTIDYVIGGGTNLTIAGVVDATTVTITPTVAVGSRAANVPFTIQLQASEAYTLHTSLPFQADLTGSRVTSTKPIALFGGNTAARVPLGVPSANHLIEQLPPVASWGSRFATLPLAGRSGGDTLRILAQHDNTRVTINNAEVATLQAGKFIELVTDQASLIESSAPVLVAQYSNGFSQDGSQADPFMMLVPPQEQLLSDYTLTTPSNGFDSNYVNIIAPTEAVDSVRLDGISVAGLFSTIGTSGLAGAQIPVSVGSHRIQSDLPSSAALYGFAAFDAYGYYAGMGLAGIASIGSLVLTPANANLPLGTLHTLTATVLDQAGQPIRGVRVDFEIEGITSENRFAFTGNDGRASIQLTRNSAGSDRVTAIVAARSSVATINWAASGPVITIQSPTPGGQVLAGPRLITGSVSPGTTGASIVEVTVNGLPVSSLDASGNFFAPVEITEGSQSFIVSATNSLGLQAARSITIIGVAGVSGGLTVNNSFDVTGSARLEWSGSTFNRQLNRLVADLRLINSSGTPLDAAVGARFNNILPPRVSLIAPDANIAVGASGARPAKLFDSEFSPNGLASGETSSPIEVAFDNPQRDRFDIDVSILARTNRPPRFVSTPDPQATLGQSYRTTLQAVDPDSSRLNYRLLAGPAGMAVNANSGLLAWSVSSQQAGSHEVIVQADDGRGGTATQKFTLFASAAPLNRPPLITSAPTTAVSPGANYRYIVRARDPDNNSLSFELAAGPLGMSIDAANGTISYDRAVAGQYLVSVRVLDGQGGVATQSYQLRVGPGVAISSPVIVSTPNVMAVANQFYVYSVVANDPQASTLTYSLAEAPGGMSIDSVTGRISWQPTTADVGVRVVRIEVRNQAGGIGSQGYTLNVEAAVPNRNPIFTSTPPLLATVGTAYAYNTLAVDSEGPGLEYSLAVSPTGMAINRTTGRITWLPSASQLGQHSVLVVATDSAGGKGYHQYRLTVRGVNQPPQFTSTPLTSATVGTAYRYTAQAVDSEDEVTYSIASGPDGLLIEPRTGIITFTPSSNQIGTRNISLRATDARGLSAIQAFDLAIADDTTGPTVSVSFSRNNILLGESVTIQLLAVDNSGLSSTSLTIDGIRQALDANRSLNYVPTQPGLPVIVATAIDRRGNATTLTADPPLRVIDPNDTEPPVIAVSSPQSGDVLTYVTDVIGTVTDANLEHIRLEVSPSGANQWRTVSSRQFASAAGVDGIIDGVLGKFDPTLLANDLYDLRVTAQDFSGNRQSRILELAVEGGAKLGNYQYTASQDYCGCGAQFADLEVPLAGIPIRITRSYNTLDAGYVGDFGYGWRMEVAHPRINESVRASAAELAGAGPLVANPFRVGTRVYLNAPDGRRVGFTFQPVPTPGLLGAVWTPRFVADPGVEMQLEVEPISLSQLSDGTFAIYLFGLPYNPDRYTLITKDQTRYSYDQFADIQLQNVTNRQGVRLTFDAAGIHSSTGGEILWTRDDQGRITQIIDPNGNRLTYTYDQRGDLVSFENQIGDVTRMVYLTDPAHYLQSVVDPHENQVVLVAYDAQGRVAGVTDATGASTRQTYDLDSNTEVIADRMGNETTIQFDDRGNVTRLTDSLGRTVTTQYDARDRAVAITDPRGLVTRMTYDDQSNPISVIDAAGQTWTAAYNSFNDLLTRTNPLGEVDQFEYDLRGNVIRSVATNGGVTTSQFDDAGRVTSLSTARGLLYRFQYSGFDQPTLVVHPDGSSRSTVQDAMGRIQSMTDETGGLVRFVQDAVGRVSEIVAPDGARALFQYDRDRLIAKTDALGRVTRYQYDEKGRLVAIYDPIASGTVINRSVSTSQSSVAATGEMVLARFMTYNPNDWIEETTDELGRITRYDYNTVGELIRVTDPLQRKTLFTYDEVGNLTSVQDPAGRIERMVYDELNRVTSLTDASGAVWRTEYDALGNVTRQIDPRLAQTRYEYSASQLDRVINALGQVVEFSYDFLGNVIARRDERGFVTTYEYDSRNRLVAQTDPAGARQTWGYDAFGSVIETIDPLGARTTNQYDSMHRLVRSISPSGGQVTFVYDAAGNVIEITDPLGRVTRREYDALDRLTRTVDPRDGQSSFVYDAVGNLLSLADAQGNVTQWQYDDLDRVTTHIDPLGAVSTLEYDLAGNVSRSRDRSGRVKDYRYDRVDRLVEEVWRDTANAVVDTRSFAYDLVGNMLRADDSDSRLGFSYDLLGQLTTADNLGTPGAAQIQLSYGYDAAGNRTRVVDNLGVSVDSAYNSRNLLEVRSWSGLSGAAGPAGARFEQSYDARGQLAELNRFSGVSATQPGSRLRLDYDQAGRVTSIRNSSAIDQVFAEYETVWDVADQLVNWNINGRTRGLTYDATGQLIEVVNSDNSVAERYQYDLNGNRQSNERVNGANNRLQSDASFDYEYDAEGNRIRQVERATGHVTSYRYDHDNHLQSAEVRSADDRLLSTIHWRYDAMGRRISRTADSDGAGPQVPVTQTYVYDGDEVWLDADAGGAVTARYLSGDGTDDLVARYRAADGLAWYVSDHLGSVRAILDANGNVVAELDYDSFGNVLAITGSTNAVDRYQFTGREFDAILNQYDYRTRYYDPVSGVFTTEDTIGFWGGDTNLARYTANAPAANRDPFGTTTIETVFAYRYGADVGRAAAGAEIGFALGYICGFVEAWYMGAGLSAEDRFAFATSAATRSANEGASIGALLGILGGSQTAAVRWATYSYGVVLAIEGIVSSPNAGVAAIRSACIAAGVAFGVAKARSVTPVTFAVRSITQNPRLHYLWEASIRELYAGKGRIGRALREYLNTIEAGKTPTATQARNAFNSVRSSFIRKVNEAIQNGEQFPGYSFESIHHWNWYMSNYVMQALDPRQLFPVSASMHKTIHSRAAQGPIVEPLDIYYNPINPRHELPLDNSYPLAPR